MTDVLFPDPHPQTCKKCQLSISEGHAYELGDDRWHIHCFKCSKCNASLGCNSNFLVLGDGSLICSNCSYKCKQCGQKIDDLAILTGDQAYCPSCFRCRVCKLKIEDLRYARTSKGLFCMSCHEKLIAKKRKYDLKKRQMAQFESLLRPPSDLVSEIPHDPTLRNSFSPSVSSDPHSTRGNYIPRFHSSTSTLNVSKDKPLPPPSEHSLKSSSLLSTATKSTDEIEEINDSDDELNLRKARRALDKSSNSLSNHWPKHASKDHILDLIDSFTGPSTSSADLAIPSSTEDKYETLRPEPLPRAEPRFGITAAEMAPPLSSSSNTTENIYNQSPSVQSLGPSPNNLNSNVADSQPSSLYSGSSSQINEKTRHLPRKNSSSTTPTEFLKTTHSNLNSISSHSTLNGYYNTPNNQHTATSSQHTAMSSQHQKSNSNVTPSLENAPRLEPKGHLSSPQRNLLLLSPSQYHDTAFHNALAPSQEGTDEFPRRSAAASPMGKVNRQARVVETNDDIVASEISLDFNNSFNVTTPKKSKFDPNKPVASPPPRVALPSTPQKEAEPESSEPRGLGLENVDLQRSAKVFHSSTPTVTNLEDTINQNTGKNPEHEVQQTPPSISRKNTFKGAKNFLRHKRSTSNGLGGGSKFNIFRNKDEPGTYQTASHSRHVSEGSINHALAFTTPPLPLSSPMRHGKFGDHSRSASDTPFMSSLEAQNERNRMESELRAIRNELDTLESRKQTILSENARLSAEKRSLLDSLNNLRQDIARESKDHERLLNDIHLLVSEKGRLTEENQNLRDQNSRLKRNQQPPKADASPVVSYNNEGQSSSSTSLPSEPPAIEEPAETLKATRLKFWRRPKITVASTNSEAQGQISQQNTPSNNANGQQGYPQNGGNANQAHAASKFSQTYSSNAIQHPSQYLTTDPNAQNESGARKALNTFISKSKSSNGLDSYIANAPLFTSTIQARATFENETVPLLITKCIEEVEQRGVNVEGIYRISGGNSAICSILDTFAGLTTNPRQDKKQMAKLNEVMSGDIHAVTSALKRYLRKLPEPLIPFSLYDAFVGICQNRLSVQSRCNDLTNKVVNKLPLANKHTLYLLSKHLDLIGSHNEVNRMTMRNLSVVFAPTIARDATGEKEMTDMGPRNEVTEMLLSNFSAVFANYEA